VEAHERPLRGRDAALRCSRKGFERVLSQAVRVGVRSKEARASYLRQQREGARQQAAAGGREGIPAAPSRRADRPVAPTVGYADRGVPNPEALGIETGAGGSGRDRGAGAKRPAPAPAPAASRPAKRPAKRGGRGGIPIIVVPSGVQAKLGLANARDFLERGRFVPLAEAKRAARASGSRRASVVVVQRTTKRDAPVPYHVVEEFPKTREEQARVVACFVKGEAWQFKGWPFRGVASGDMLECFASLRGFYLGFADEKVPDAVLSWNVKRLALHRDNRHEDAAVALQCWDAIDEFVSRSEALREALSY